MGPILLVTDCRLPDNFVLDNEYVYPPQGSKRKSSFATLFVFVLSSLNTGIQQDIHSLPGRDRGSPASCELIPSVRTKVQVLSFLPTVNNYPNSVSKICQRISFLVNSSWYWAS